MLPGRPLLCFFCELPRPSHLEERDIYVRRGALARDLITSRAQAAKDQGNVRSCSSREWQGKYPEKKLFKTVLLSTEYSIPHSPSSTMTQGTILRNRRPVFPCEGPGAQALVHHYRASLSHTSATLVGSRCGEMVETGHGRNLPPSLTEGQIDSLHPPFHALFPVERELSSPDSGLHHL